MSEAVQYRDPSWLVPFKERLGQCYALAGTFALEHLDTELVHGSIEGMGQPRLGHAWVVIPNGQVWEPVSAMTLPQDAFERMFNPEVHFAYESWEWREYAYTTKNWGPWDDPEEGTVKPYRH